MAATVCAILSATADAENSHTTPRLGDFHGSHRRREIASRRHPIPDPVQVLIPILPEILDRLAVYPGRTLVGLDPLIRFPHSPLGNVKRLVL